MSETCCGTQTKKRTDWILFVSIAFCLPTYFLGLINIFPSHSIWHHMTQSTFELINQMSLGVLLGLLFVGLLDQIPREFTLSILGTQKGFKGILRATLLGLLLDLCSHGILMIGMKLYKKGATIGQTMAFLIASPWNSFSLTIILFTLIGLKWTITFILLSMLIALITGVIFDSLVKKQYLPDNPNKKQIDSRFLFLTEAKKSWSQFRFTSAFFKNVLMSGITDSKIIVKWLLFGVMIAVLLRAFVPIDAYKQYLGPGYLGLLITLIFATVLEVCSEGSTPIAADIFNIANAPGNSFAFLMTGISTDYTEIMTLKETSNSWKLALYLPLVTLPQVIFVSLIINYGYMFNIK